MKLKFFLFILIPLIFFPGCSKEEPFTTILPQTISFAKANGTLLEAGECLNPNENYAVFIGVSTEGGGKFKTTKIEYTVNGILHSMTFTNGQSQHTPVQLIEGINIAQLVVTGVTKSIMYANRQEFELVE